VKPQPTVQSGFEQLGVFSCAAKSSVIGISAFKANRANIIILWIPLAIGAALVATDVTRAGRVAFTAAAATPAPDHDVAAVIAPASVFD